MGYGVSVHTLHAPKGKGFELIGKVYHHDYQGQNDPVWAESLALEARPRNERAACWPLVAVGERRAAFKENPPLMLRAERRMRCRADGTYGTVYINHRP